METLISSLQDILTIEFTVLVIAALPIIELRGAIPIGLSLGMSPLHAFITSFIGSMVPVPFILFTIRPILKYLRGTKFFRNIVNKITDNSFKKNAAQIKKYGTWGLFILVAIPLPGTGVWSGSLIASLMNLRFKWAFPAILFGNLIAGLIIMGISYRVF